MVNFLLSLILYLNFFLDSFCYIWKPFFKKKEVSKTKHKS